MEIKELNEFRRKMFDEIIKIDSVKEALKYSRQIYIYTIEEGNKHIIAVFEKITHLNKSFLIENGFTENAYIKRLYTVNKQTKQCY